MAPQVALRLAASNPSSIKRRMASFSEGKRSSKRKSEMRLAWSSVRLTNFFIGYAASLLIKKQISHIDHIDNTAYRAYVLYADRGDASDTSPALTTKISRSDRYG